MGPESIAPVALYGLCAAALAVSLVTDLWRQLIYNWVTFPTMALALGLRLAIGGFGPAWGGWGLASGLAGLAIGFGFFLVPYLFGGGVKEGDVKLAGAVGACVGLPAILPCLLFIALVGGVEAVLYLLWRGKFLRTLLGVLRLVGHRLRLVGDRPALEGELIPYGVAIALGSAWGTAWSMLANLGAAE